MWVENGLFSLTKPVAVNVHMILSDTWLTTTVAVCRSTFVKSTFPTTYEARYNCIPSHVSRLSIVRVLTSRRVHPATTVHSGATAAAQKQTIVSAVS